MRFRFFDAHCHAYGFPFEELKRFLDGGIVIVGVAEDFESSLKLIEFAKKLKGLLPAVGVHPWRVAEVSDEEITRILELKRETLIFGEIGLDTKFVPQSIERQREVFKRFLEIAAEEGLILNLHTAGTWEEVFDLITKAGIKRALFHWYTGPKHLLKEIEAQGYFISINPAVKIQKRHREIVKEAPMEILLTESDGPYNYRGLMMTPDLVPEVVKEIASIKDLDVEDVRKTIEKNFVKLFEPALR